jgi:hypothetical protein
LRRETAPAKAGVVDHSPGRTAALAPVQKSNRPCGNGPGWAVTDPANIAPPVKHSPEKRPDGCPLGLPLPGRIGTIREVKVQIPVLAQDEGNDAIDRRLIDRGRIEDSTGGAGGAYRGRRSLMSLPLPLGTIPVVIVQIPVISRDEGMEAID